MQFPKHSILNKEVDVEAIRDDIREMSALRNNGVICARQRLILPPTAEIRTNDLETRIRLTAIIAEKKVI